MINERKIQPTYTHSSLLFILNVFTIFIWTGQVKGERIFSWGQPKNRKENTKKKESQTNSDLIQYSSEASLQQCKKCSSKPPRQAIQWLQQKEMESWGGRGDRRSKNQQGPTHAPDLMLQKRKLYRTYAIMLKQKWSNYHTTLAVPDHLMERTTLNYLVWDPQELNCRATPAQKP